MVWLSGADVRQVDVKLLVSMVVLPFLLVDIVQSSRSSESMEVIVFFGMGSAIPFA